MNNKLNLCIKYISCANVLAEQTTFLRSREKKFTRTFRRKKIDLHTPGYVFANNTDVKQNNEL